MRTLTTSSGHIIKVDSDNFDAVSDKSWYLVNGYPAREIGTRKTGRTTEYLHRVIMAPPEGMTVDHINRDKLDNRKTNLRICTHGENCRNRTSSIGTSKYKGVAYVNARDKWMASIYIDSANKFLGHYEDEDLAAMAYNQAAIKHYGEYALINTGVS